MNTPIWTFLDATATIVSCVVTLFYGFPAYQRTKQIGFVYWGAGALSALFNSLTLHTIGSDYRSNPAAYVFFHQSYRVLFVVDAILGIMGTIKVINGYLLLFEAQNRNPPPLPGQAVAHSGEDLSE